MEFNQKIVREHISLNSDYLYENMLCSNVNEGIDIKKMSQIISNIKDKNGVLKNITDKFNNTTNQKIKNYLAVAMVMMVLTSPFVTRNNIKSVEKASSEIASKQKIKVPEVKKITNIHIPSVSPATDKGDIKHPINVDNAKISNHAKNLIKEHEKLSTTAYVLKYKVKDKKGNVIYGEDKKPIVRNDGNVTIGYGHGEPIGSSKFKEGDRISKEKAEELFNKDIAIIENGVKRIFKEWQANGINVDITQGMFDSMVSMAYNMGISALRNSKFIEHLKINDHIAAAETIKTLRVSTKFPGLVDRRQKEYEMFVKDLNK